MRIIFHSQTRLNEPEQRVQKSDQIPESDLADGITRHQHHQDQHGAAKGNPLFQLQGKAVTVSDERSEDFCIDEEYIQELHCGRKSSYDRSHRDFKLGDSRAFRRKGQYVPPAA